MVDDHLNDLGPGFIPPNTNLSCIDLIYCSLPEWKYVCMLSFFLTFVFLILYMYMRPFIHLQPKQGLKTTRNLKTRGRYESQVRSCIFMTKHELKLDRLLGFYMHFFEIATQKIDPVAYEIGLIYRRQNSYHNFPN